MAAIRHAEQGAQSEESDVRETPRPLFDAYHKRYDFTIDVAATHQNALCARYFTERGKFLRQEIGWIQIGLCCGLSSSWQDERVWCNPPFSELDLWVYKAWTSDAKLAVMLLPNDRLDRKWWHALVEPFRDGHSGGKEPPGSMVLTTENVPGRQQFTINGGQPILNAKTGKKSGAMFGVTILIFRRL